MTDTYLRSLGFAPVLPGERANKAAFARAWRYQYDYEAGDGAHLFIEHPLGIEACRLSSMPAPLTAQDVFASVGLHDKPGLSLAIKAFYDAHGGMRGLLPAAPVSEFRPYRPQ